MRIGFELGRTWALDRCHMEKVEAQDESDDTYNGAISDCIDAIKAMDVRHALASVEEKPDADAPRSLGD